MSQNKVLKVTVHQNCYGLITYKDVGAWGPVKCIEQGAATSFCFPIFQQYHSFVKLVKNPGTRSDAHLKS